MIVFAYPFLPAPTMTGPPAPRAASERIATEDTVGLPCSEPGGYRARLHGASEHALESPISGWRSGQ